MQPPARPNQAALDKSKPLAVPPPPVRRPPPPPHEKTAAEVMAGDSGLIDGLFLVMNGVPFDVAFSLDDDERLAYVVIIGTLKGLRYNWAARRWEDPK